MSVTDVESFLEHHGVRGQRWGVRTTASGGTTGTPTAKSSGGSGGSGGSGVKAGSEKSSKAKTAHLTNDELKKVIERMKLDQQFHEITNPKKNAGKKFASSVLQDSGKKLIGAVVATAATIAVTMALGKHVARSEIQKENFKTGLRTADAAKTAFKFASPTGPKMNL
jgi:hypothetical protein